MKQVLFFIALVNLMGCLFIPGKAVITRGPYLQSGSTNSLVIRWRTDIPVQGRVFYGDSLEEQNSKMDGPKGTEHSVTLKDLKNNHIYYYSIASDNSVIKKGPELFFQTSPADEEKNPIRIWVLGDPGTHDQSQKSVYEAYKKLTLPTRSDLVLLLGDNAYEDGTDRDYQMAIFEMYQDLLENTVFWPTFGNRDGKSASSADQSGAYYEIFTLPTQAEAGGTPSETEAYYSFDYGPIHFISLNSHDSDRSSQGTMLQWLKKDLESNQKKWLIAFFHHAPFSHGTYSTDAPDPKAGKRGIEMRENIVPLLEAYGADLVLTGHSHVYERSFLLHGHYGPSATLKESMILNHSLGQSDTGSYKKSAGRSPGTVYVVTGSAGKTKAASLDHPAMAVSFSRLGSFLIEVNKNTLTGTFLSSDETVLDSFSIKKSPSSSADRNSPT